MLQGTKGHVHNWCDSVLLLTCLTTQSSWDTILLTYFTLSLVVLLEHRPLMKCLGPIFSSWVHVSPSVFFISCSGLLLQVFWAFLCPFYPVVPCWSLFGYCFFVSSECVTNPAPVSPPKFDRHGFDVVDFIWPGDPDDVSQTAGDEGLQFTSDVIGGPSGFWSRHQHGLNIGVEDPELGIEWDVFAFTDPFSTRWKLFLRFLFWPLQPPLSHCLWEDTSQVCEFVDLFQSLVPDGYGVHAFIDDLHEFCFWYSLQLRFVLHLLVQHLRGTKIFCQETLLPRLERTFTVLLLWIQPVMIKGVENANFVVYIYMYIFCFFNESSDLRLIGRLTSAQLHEVRLRGRPGRCYHDWLVGGLNPDKLQPPHSDRACLCPSSPIKSLPPHTSDIFIH